MTRISLGPGESPPHGHDRDAARPAGLAGPGVPLTIWPGLPAPAGPPCGGPVTAAAAARVIESFSRPGDRVAVAGGSPAVTGAAAAAGRAVAGFVADGLGGHPVPVPERADWASPRGPAQAPALRSPVTGQAALAVAGFCRPGCCAASCDGQDGGLLLAACERVLRPGGVLAVITAVNGVGAPPDGQAGAAVAAARAAGLVYAQHIVLVHAAIDGDRLDPGPAVGPAALPGGTAVHSDLLVFTKPGGPRL